MTDKHSARGRGRVVRSRRFESLTALAEIDQRLLGVLCAHRVVTQEQLCRLFPRVPERTLRYRTRRLHDLGLAGRSRPYRESGSAPNHHWPTRRADCLMRGEPMPRGGERREPNSLFLAHAAALTDLYVTLATEAHTLDLRLHTYRREEDAREPFNDGTRNRSLAPDALIVLQDSSGRALWAFVEIDRGSMSHTRLRQKAAGYLAYAKARAWQQHRPFMPVLLFLTISTSRAYRFLDNLARMLNHSQYSYTPFDLTAVAGAVALHPKSLLDDPCLADTHGNSHLMLVDVLNSARAPYERAQAKQREQEQAEANALRELIANPQAVRDRLRKQQSSLAHYLAGLGASGEATIGLLLDNTSPPDVEERAALQALARDLGTKLLAARPSGLPEPSATARCDIKLLTDHYHRSQQRLLSELAHRYGDGPSLRLARQTLQDGALIEHHNLSALSANASRDRTSSTEQHERRLAYEQWRERAACRLAREAGPLGRLTHRREQYYPQLDRKRLRVCGACGETIYPGPPGTGSYGYQEPSASSCHYCREARVHNTQPYDPDKHASTQSEAQP